MIDRTQLGRLPHELFSANRDLSKIDVGHNRIRVIHKDTFQGLSNLKELRAPSNGLVEFPYTALGNVSSLEVLILAENALTNVDFTKLYELRRLRELDLHSNTIASVSGFTNTNLSHLQGVDLSDNQLAGLITNFFYRSSSILRLNLAKNQFKQIPNPLSGQNLPNLRFLNLTRNPIQDLTFTRRFSSLQEIHISFTNISVITSKDFENYPVLLHLFLNRNRLVKISPSAFKALKSLLTLDLSGNELEFLPQERLQGLPVLRLLNLSHNQLKDLELFSEDLRALQVLDLNFNQISRVAKSTFSQLASLTELHLFGNWISSVASDAFRPLKRLRLLDLGRNYLESLPLNALRPLETQIRTLRTEGEYRSSF